MSKPTPTKAMLQELVDSLPDDLGYGVYADMGAVISWMASPQREWQQGGTNGAGEVAQPPWYPIRRRYFVIFEPKEQP